jgi:hypothetical protein
LSISRDYPRAQTLSGSAAGGDLPGAMCAQKSPANWYRTIDRITRRIAESKPKLLIPDIKGNAHIVFEKASSIRITTSIT